MTPERATPDGRDDTSTRNRILAATNEVLARNGHAKLSLSEVALQAGVSRPTLYRWFASKAELLEAFGRYEGEMFDSGINRATAGLRGNEKLDAALYVIPQIRVRLEKLLSGPNAAVKAATTVRVAVSHYLVRSDDDDQFLAQLRHAAGIRPPG
jgi:AcrR family transcriptional regulator